jgi:chromate transporter
MTFTLTVADWLSLFVHFISLSLLAVGGAITTVPDIHRYLVDEQHWLTDTQFTSSIALAQGAPGPNVMCIALMVWVVLPGDAYRVVFVTVPAGTPVYPKRSLDVE